MTANPYPRYAVYYALPRESALWERAQSWLGRDCETGRPLPQPRLDGWAEAELAEATESPRRYGFHATLKAPFHLSPDWAVQRLRDAVGIFAAQHQAFVAPPLKVSAIGPFLALTFSEAAPAMENLAAAAVRDLEILRAPLTEENLRRRLAQGLSPRQESLLRTWGYPYVFEEFRFHMTLTGPLADKQKRERLQEALTAYFGQVLDQDTPVQEVCLYTQSNPEAPFILSERFRLADPQANDSAKTENSENGQAVL